MKMCFRCGLEKHESCFHRSKKNRDGYSSHCKACDKIAQDRRRLENPEAVKASERRWKEKTRESAKLYARKYRSENSEKFLAGCIATRRKNPARYLLANARVRAAQKGFEFSITEADIVIPTHCPVFGFPLKPCPEKRGMDSPSIDRLDNSKGYVPGNIAVISYKANMIKGLGTAEEHESIALWMRERGNVSHGRGRRSSVHAVAVEARSPRL